MQPGNGLKNTYTLSETHFQINGDWGSALLVLVLAQIQGLRNWEYLSSPLHLVEPQRLMEGEYCTPLLNLTLLWSIYIQYGMQYVHYVIAILTNRSKCLYHTLAHV